LQGHAQSLQELTKALVRRTAYDMALADGLMVLEREKEIKREKHVAFACSFRSFSKDELGLSPEQWFGLQPEAAQVACAAFHPMVRLLRFVVCLCRRCRL